MPGARAESIQHLKIGERTEPTRCETRWDKIISSFKRNHKELLEGHPGCSEELALLRSGLHTTGQIIHISPPVNGNDAVWKELIARAEAEMAVLCKHLDGMLRLYAALHRELRDSSLPAEQKSTEEYREQWMRKRNSSDEKAKKSKTSVPMPESRDPRLRPKGEVPTKNFFAPLRTAEMDVERTLVESTSDEANSELQQLSSNKSGRPPPIVLTTATNLMKLQRHIRDIFTGNFEFRTPGAGPELSRRKWRIFLSSGSTLTTTTSPSSPSFQNQKNTSRL
jgi:hypothetical protein